ncbi:MAG: MFS transporter [Chloroflexota bacterium]
MRASSAKQGAGQSQDTAPNAEPAGNILRQWQFRRFLVAVLSWGSGRQLVLLSNPFLVYDLTNDPLWIAYLGVAAAVPQFVMAAVGGMLADRFPRKTLLVIGSSTAGLLMLVLAALSWLDALEPWHIVVAAFGFGAALGNDWTNRLAFIPSIADRSQWTRAMSFDQSAFQTARVLAPLAGGALLAQFGGRATYTAGLILFTMAATLLYSTRPRPDDHSERHPPLWEGIREVGQLVKADTVLRAMLVFTAVNALLVGGFVWLAPAFAKDVLGGGAGEQGAILTATGLGAVAGATWVGSKAGIRRAGLWLLVSNALMVAMLGGFSLSAFLFLSVAFAAAGGFFNAMHVALGAVTIQTRVTDIMRGRVFGVYEMAWGFFPTGGIVFGGLAAAFGPVGALLAGVALVAAVTIGIAALSPSTRRLRFSRG